MKINKEKILEWLKGKRSFSEGVLLYQKYGLNVRLKREFGYGETPELKEILVSSLMDLAGVDEKSLRNKTSDSRPVAVSKYKPTDGQEKKMLGFRERFPFLKDPDCPDVLKVAVADLFTSFDQYRKAHGALVAADDGEVMYEECRKAVENSLINRECWDLLEYYKEHGELPGKYLETEKSEEEIAGLSDLDLASKLKSAVANESKHKKALAALQQKGEPTEKAEGMVQYWTARKQALRDELERRKKK